MAVVIDSELTQAFGHGFEMAAFLLATSDPSDLAEINTAAYKHNLQIMGAIGHVPVEVALTVAGQIAAPPPIVEMAIDTGRESTTSGKLVPINTIDAYKNTRPLKSIRGMIVEADVLKNLLRVEPLLGHRAQANRGEYQVSVLSQFDQKPMIRVSRIDRLHPSERWRPLGSVVGLFRP